MMGMSTTIDTLDIKIQSNSTSASKALDKLTSSLSALNRQSHTGVGSLNRLSNSIGNLGNGKTTKGILSLGNALKGVLTTATFKKVGEAIGGWINSTNEYIENVNLFTVSMGEYAEEATKYAEMLQELMGIDSSEFMRNQGVFMSMANGFGLAKDQAYQLSKGMTEVSYDLSSFFNLPIEEAFAKVRSGIAGELEPLRALGFALSQATLEELAREKGINKAVASMTEAEKALLRYTAIVEQAGEEGMGAIGDFARTIENPSNALRIFEQQVKQLGRALGSVFIPLLAKAMPYVLAFTKVITDLVRKLAALFGFNIKDWTPDVDVSSGYDDMSESIDNATASAKKFKNAQMGFDELNVIDPNQGSGSGASGGASFSMDLKEVWTESMLSGITNEVNGIIEKFTTLGETIKTTFLESKDHILDFVMVVGSLAAGVAIGSVLWNGLTALAMLSNTNATGFAIITNAFKTIIFYIELFGSTVVSWFGGASAAFAPVTLIVLGIASAIYVLWKNWETVVAVVKGFFEQIDLAGKFESIKNSLAPLLEKVAGLSYLFEAIGTVVVALLQPVFAVLGGLFNALIYAAQGLIDMASGVLDILTALGQFLVGVFTGDLSLVKDSVKNLIVGIMTLFSGMCEFVIGTIVGFVEGVIQWFVNLWDVLVGHSIVPDMVNAIVEWFGSLKDSAIRIISNMVTGVVNFFKTMWSNIKQFWNANIAPKLTVSYWTTKFDGLKEGFKKTVKNMLNSGIDMLNKFIGWLNSKLRFSWEPLKILGKQVYPGGSVQLFTIPQITQRFEDGGFIEDGLFTMNRGEIAGKFNNGKSVVANNEQIIEGISQGVYAAFTKALSENSGNNTYHIYLDGKEIRASIKKNEADSGLSLFGSEIGYGF
jgi:hypothetical protein